VSADAYDRFMGRYSVPLAPRLCDLAAIARGQRVLDDGCGPGALTRELATRLGPGAVFGVDPSEPFVEAVRERHPEVRVRLAAAERLPFRDGEFDAALAQLVVHRSDVAVPRRRPRRGRGDRPLCPRGVPELRRVVGAVHARRRSRRRVRGLARPGPPEALRARCRAALPDAPFTLTAHAWAARRVV
jgi:SAM-dependent methyltransferase